jgi:diguanylate cyclase (GGDEF)-like protein/PAS domain S-box-containing protein
MKVVVGRFAHPGERRPTVTLLDREREFLHLLNAVAVAANEARTVDEALQRVLDEVCAYTHWPVGHAYLPGPDGVLAPTGLWHLADPDRYGPFRRSTEGTCLQPGQGFLGGVLRSREPAWTADASVDLDFLRAAAAREVGLGAGFGLPVLLDGEAVAILEFFLPESLEPDESLLELGRHIGLQLGRVVERERIEATLRAGEDRIRAVIDTASEAFIGMDEAGMVTEWNRRAEEIFGWPREEVIGRAVADLVVPEDMRATHWGGLRRFLDTGQSAVLGRTMELRAQARDGRVFPVELSAWSTPSGSTVEISAFIRDISDRMQVAADLTRQALHDSLTGLPNRTLFLDRLAHALARSERNLYPVTVLVLDLDNFKRFNDSLRHAAGDRLLASVAERLRDTIRPADTVARLGGDEFAVLLEDTGIADGIRIAQRLGEALDRPFAVGGHDVVAQASVGVACGIGGALTADDLLTNADLAMYLAKGQGKARYAVFEAAMHDAAIERLELEGDLRQALVRGEFFLLYQPVVRIGTGSLVGMEALIRWKRGGGEVVPPDQFIPAAEETGLIREIGHWVLQEACRQVATWQAEHHPTPALRLSVNFSARQFEDPEIVKEVERVLVAAGLEPGCLVIELTESLLISEPDVAIRQLGDLRHLGVRLAIDDFGTGYSSLSYLRRFPVDILKIDRSFVSALGGDPEDAALAHAIVKLGRTLHLRVVAEGVETAAQLAELRAIDCEYGQGYLFGRPLTIEAMSVVLAAAAEGHRLEPGGEADSEPPALG